MYDAIHSIVYICCNVYNDLNCCVFYNVVYTTTWGWGGDAKNVVYSTTGRNVNATKIHTPYIFNLSIPFRRKVSHQAKPGLYIIEVIKNPL